MQLSNQQFQFQHRAGSHNSSGNHIRGAPQHRVNVSSGGSAPSSLPLISSRHVSDCSVTSNLPISINPVVAHPHSYASTMLPPVSVANLSSTHSSTFYTPQGNFTPHNKPTSSKQNSSSSQGETSSSTVVNVQQNTVAASH